LNVTELTGILAIAQSGVSRHLGLLKDAGLVSEEREGGFTYYRGAAAVILVFGLFPDAIVSLTRRSTPSLTTDAPASGAQAGMPRTTSGANTGVVALRPDPLSR